MPIVMVTGPASQDGPGSLRRARYLIGGPMADELKAGTCGVDHVGLSVRDLVSTRKFFCDCLGWRIVGERADYPAVFVSDGHDIVTLWQGESPGKAIAFDRRADVGFHHFGPPVAHQICLRILYKRGSGLPGVAGEVWPEPPGAGPHNHFFLRG